MPFNVNIALLPGMDGTGDLFRRFLEFLIPGIDTRTVSFPVNRVLTYQELAEVARESIPPGRFFLLGESFSGPLALRLAKTVNPLGLILCATFVRSPVPRGFVFPDLFASLFKAIPSPTAISALLTGGDIELAREVVNALSKVERKVIASRIRMILELDVTRDLADSACPIMYLRGAKDRIVNSKQSEMIRSIRKDAEFASINAPHLVLQTKPRECWALISSFIGKHAHQR